jgi:predicted nucleic acid-binding protein
MKRIVIADAGPLIALARIDQLDLLPRLFGKVSVTDVVANELSRGGVFPDTDRLIHALGQSWLETVCLPDPWEEACRDWMNLHQIDLGEASALVLASQAAARGDEVLVIVDDARGRLAAQHARMAITGTAGLLVLGKNHGLLPAVKPLLLALQTQGYFLSERLVQAVLRQAGEG